VPCGQAANFGYTKAQLCARLCESPVTNVYEFEYAPTRFSYKMMDDYMNHTETSFTGAKRPNGIAQNYLKQKCRDKGLVVSGKRFDLILRLLQDACGTGQPKRAANSEYDETTGTFQPKKRAKSMTLPDAEKIRERAYKKAFPPDSVTLKWPNWTSKQHCSRCIALPNDIIEKEIFEKLLFE